MELRELVPWHRGLSPSREGDGEHSLRTLHQRIDRLFEDFWRDIESPLAVPAWKGGASVPRVNVTEDDKEFVVSAELPGLEEKDIELELNNNILTIRGETQAEKEEKDKNYYLMERTHGTFQRSIPFPAEIDEDKVKAAHKDGVLTVTLPKTAAARKKTRKIKVTTK